MMETRTIVCQISEYSFKSVNESSYTATMYFSRCISGES